MTNKQTILIFLLVLLATTNAVKKGRAGNTDLSQSLQKLISSGTTDRDKLEMLQKLINDPSLLEHREAVKVKAPAAIPSGVTTFNSNFETSYSVFVKNNSACQSATISGSAIAGQSVNAETFTASNLHMDTLEINKLKNADGPITINGDVVVTGIQSTQPLSTNSLIVTGYEQWALAAHDDFETEESLKGWNLLETSSCAPISQNIFLGGHCLTADKEMEKIFENLPPHSMIRIKANYHMLDNWTGETGYMNVDDQLMAWRQRGMVPMSNKMLNQCGNGDHADPLMNRQVDKIMEHGTSTVKLTFGSTLSKDPCEASYAIDDVMIFVR
jgi:hypothetical protein